MRGTGEIVGERRKRKLPAILRAQRKFCAREKKVSVFTLFLAHPQSLFSFCLSRAQTSDSGTSREFRAKRRHECLYASHEDRFTRFRGFLRRAPRYTCRDVHPRSLGEKEKKKTRARKKEKLERLKR